MQPCIIRVNFQALNLFSLKAAIYTINTSPDPGTHTHVLHIFPGSVAVMRVSCCDAACVHTKNIHMCTRASGATIADPLPEPRVHIMDAFWSAISWARPYFSPSLSRSDFTCSHSKSIISQLPFAIVNK